MGRKRHMGRTEILPFLKVSDPTLGRPPRELCLRLNTEGFPGQTQAGPGIFEVGNGIRCRLICAHERHPTVALTRAAREQPFCATAKPNWDILTGSWVDAGGVDRVKVPVKTKNIFLPELPQEFDLLSLPIAAIFKRNSEGFVLDFIPTGANAESKAIV